MLPSKDKLNLKSPVMLTDNQLWAVGLVVATWTQVENWLKIVAHGLTAEGSPQRKEFDETLPFRTRLDLVKAMILDQLRSPYRQDFMPIITETRNCQYLRDKIVHNTWGDSGSDTPTYLFNWMKPDAVFDWKLDFGGIKTVAVRIDALAYSWQTAVLADERIGEGMTLVADALNRKRHTPI